MNLYVHFPFCRSKCTYCALHSRAGAAKEARDAYVSRLVESIRVVLGSFRVDSASCPNLPYQPPVDSASCPNRPYQTPVNSASCPNRPYQTLKTLYFGGGSPALCDLEPLFAALKPHLAEGAEFTVELHPLDVTRELLARLKAGGVNRISMGVQSLDDGILSDMRRGYTFHEAERAFALTKEFFDNAGIDLIVGYPGETSALTPRHARLAKWGLAHCSVYSLILEPNSILGRRRDGGPLPDDETVLNRIATMSRFLGEIGLSRYEISNYAVPGRACRHNMAVWRGEDYIGLGDGAHGRMGLSRTQNWWGGSAGMETTSPAKDAIERKIFALRTKDGLDLADERWGKTPQDWASILDKFVVEGLLSKDATTYTLTERGTEVCDSIMAELV